MIDNEKPDELENDEEVLLAEEIVDGEPPAEAGGDASEAGLEELQADLEKARREAADYLDNLQRLKAEFDNFRKRMLREQSEFLKFAAQGVIGELLPVIDNFERALDQEDHGDQFDDYKKGMKLVYGQLLEALAKEGLSMVEPVGQPFDPNLHEAVMQEESTEHPEGTVVRVLERVYVLQDRIIKHAKVSVAK